MDHVRALLKISAAFPPTETEMPVSICCRGAIGSSNGAVAAPAASQNGKRAVPANWRAGLESNRWQPDSWDDAF